MACALATRACSLFAAGGLLPELLPGYRDNNPAPCVRRRHSTTINSSPASEQSAVHPPERPPIYRR